MFFCYMLKNCIIWPCILMIVIMTWLLFGILFIYSPFLALLGPQINNMPSKSHVIVLLTCKPMGHNTMINTEYVQQGQAFFNNIDS